MRGKDSLIVCLEMYIIFYFIFVVLALMLIDI